LQYRPVGDTGITVSALGFGTMRFKGPENAAEIINRGRELGLTYYDIGSAYSFKSFDENAEVWTGAAIKGVPREEMVLSAKAQPRAGEPRIDRGLGISTRDQMWECIENSLKRVGVEWFDFYQLWDMSADDHFETGCIGKDTPLQAMREAKEQGLVRHLGFTTHARPELVIRMLKEVSDFRTITLYYNFTDRAPEEALAYAAQNGVGVKIMGPLRGGLLTGHSPAFERALPEFAGSPVQEIALRFLLGTDGVSSVLSGLNEIAHLEQNASYVDLPPMTAEQRSRFIAAFQEFSKGEPLCSSCRYCMGSCPQHLPVMQHMGLYQLHAIFEISSGDKMIAGAINNERQDPRKCTGCGSCVEKCPQKLPIPERMAKLAELSAALQSAAS
jgi:predicted aldo/keto reductase-like oxidoreductase